MRKISLIIIALALIGISKANAQNCCAKPGDMKALAMNMDFKSAHAAPEPFEYVAKSGSMIEFATENGKSGSAFYIPSPSPTKNVLIVFHEWWGLNDYIKQEAEKLQQSLGNVEVYAVDLYDGQVAADPETAGKLMGKEVIWP